MARYSELYSDGDLIKLRDGLDILETHGLVEYGNEITGMNIWLYGIVTDASILERAKEALIDSEEEFMDDLGGPTVSESDMTLTEIAIAVQIRGSGTIDTLHRGYPLNEPEYLVFAYQRGEGEGVRTAKFNNAGFSDTITLDKMSKQALYPGEDELNAYLQEQGTGKQMQVKRKVQRNEEATVNAPHIPEPPKLETPQPEPVAKQTSLAHGRKLSDIVEGFLG
jgi:hypothetical protein